MRENIKGNMRKKTRNQLVFLRLTPHFSPPRMRQVPGISVEGLEEGTAPPHLDPPATPTPLHAAVYDWHEDDDDDDYM